MADSRRYGLTPQLDIGQILLDAQHRWLRPAEICEILRNYKKFHIAPEPPNRPSSGSLFLFDRKVLRYFRKDGHNWRKKKDGKTVKEAHERLKSGSIDVLHCYYAHGEDNENFQRRSYWMLEEDLMHIVLVHYREVKNNKPSYSRSREVEDVQQVSHVDSPIGSSSFTNQSQLPSQATDADSPNSAHTSEYEDAESDNYQRSSRYHPHIEMQRYDDGSVMGAQLLDPVVPLPPVDSQCSFQEIEAAEPRCDFISVAQEEVVRLFDESGLGLTLSGSKMQLGLTSLDEVLDHYTTAFQEPYFQPSVSFSLASTEDTNSRLQPLQYENSYAVDSSGGHAVAVHDQVKSAYQSSHTHSHSSATPSGNIEYDISIEDNRNQTSLVKQSSLDFSVIEGEGLKKYDSFSRWMSKELGEVDDPQMKSSSVAYWNDLESEDVVEDSSTSNNEHLNSYIMNPSLSQEQLFSIIDFSPTWAYSASGTTVLVTGTFLKSNDLENFNWSCMFGEIEVPAEVLADGVLRCHAPPHKPGRVPFYVTCSNRLSCSEVREFEFRESDDEFNDASGFCYSSMNEMLLQTRLDKLLSLGPNIYRNQDTNILNERAQLITKLNSAMIKATDEWSDLLKLTQDDGFSPENTKNQLLEALFREKLHSWLLFKVTEDGKGPSILDEEGQGVIHLVAALGYDWAIKPIVTAGVNINFRDVHGWTALHWAASCGRERIVVTLITMGAAPGAVTDPTPQHPSGRRPADLASANGHKGIAGFLAESFLTSHLSALTIRDSKSNSAFESLTSTGNILDHAAVQEADGDTQADLSLKDSLIAVRNASQAAARIHQVFRVQSFQRKKLHEYGNEKYGVSDERALSFVAVKSAKPGPHDMPLHAAAIRIQNKFRGWKGRKEFLVIRQRIVKIQAHVRGHQVRKHLRKVVWSVGIVEKAILRWRRKGSGLRGFRSEKLLEGSSLQQQSSKEDDYDFLKEGRKRSEASLQKALARVKSMVQYPEARDQYRRLLTVVTELQESKAMQENLMNEDEEAVDGDFMIELEELHEDVMFMPGAEN